MNYLLLKADGKLYCADIPYEPTQHSNGERDSIEVNQWEQAKAEAIANALEVVNPEIRFFRGSEPDHRHEYYPHGMTGFDNPLQENKLYPWNGGAEVKEFCEKCPHWGKCHLENCPLKSLFDCRFLITKNRNALVQTISVYWAIIQLAGGKALWRTAGSPNQIPSLSS